MSPSDSHHKDGIMGRVSAAEIAALIQVAADAVMVRGAPEPHPGSRAEQSGAMCARVGRHGMEPLAGRGRFHATVQVAAKRGEPRDEVEWSSVVVWVTMVVTGRAGVDPGGER